MLLFNHLKTNIFFSFSRKSGGKNTSTDSCVAIICTYIAALVIVIVIAILLYKWFWKRKGNNHTEISNYSPPEGGRLYT